jgi:putative flippase GtrA
MLLARALAVFLAMSATWLGNQWLTFRASKPPMAKEWDTYLVANGIGALLNYSIYSLAILRGALWFPSLCLDSGTAMVYNFTINHRTIFQEER